MGQTPPAGTPGLSADSPLRYDVAFGDVNAAFSFIFRYGRRSVGRTVMLGLLALLLLDLLVLHPCRAFDPVADIGAALVVAVPLTGFVLAFTTAWRWLHWRRMHADGLTQAVEYVDSDGLHSTAAGVSQHVQWSAVTQVALTPRHLFIGTRPASAIALPRRAFPDDAAVQALVDRIYAARPDLPPLARPSSILGVAREAGTLLAMFVILLLVLNC